MGGTSFSQGFEHRGYGQHWIQAAIDGDTIVIGARWEDSNATGVDGNQNNNASFNPGAAYVFIRNGTTWTQQAYLKASNTPPFDDGVSNGDAFGISVSVDGDTIVVGATGDDSDAIGVNGDDLNNNRSSSGAAFVFKRTGAIWTQDAYLKASNSDTFEFFGSAVGISGNTVVVAMTSEESASPGVNGDQTDNSLNDAGAVYVFVSEDEILLGDVNCDGVVDLLDVGPFVDALVSGNFNAKADINEDGVVSLLDVGPFVALLSGG